MSVPFGEASVLDDGRRVLAPWDATGLYVGDVFVPGPQLRLPDAALTAGGRVWAVGAGQNGGLHLWSEATGWQVLAPGPFGKRTILRSDGEGCRVAYANSTTAWTCVAVSPTGVVSPVSTGSVPGAGGGAGMRDWDPVGNPRTAAPVKGTIDGHDVRGIVTAHDVSIACALGPLPDQIVVSRGGPLGTLQMGLVESVTLRLSANGRFWAAGLAKGGEIPATVPPLIVTPVIAPFPTPAEVGAYFAVSKRYPTDPRAPGSVVIVAERGIVTERQVILTRLAETDTGKVELIPEWANRWGQVRAVQVTTEDGPLVLEAGRARAQMQAKGLPARQIISYTGRALPGASDMDAVDAVGCECYPNPGETVAQAEAAWRAFIAGTGSRPLALMFGQWDRRKAVQGPPLIPEAVLAACQSRYEALCRELGARMRYGLAFRWAGPGGLRDYPALQPWLVAMASAYPVPPPPETPVATAKATIESFETPILLSGTSRAVAKVTEGTPDRFRWQWSDGGVQWKTAADNPASDKDHHFTFPREGQFPIRLQTVVAGVVTDTSSSTSRVVTVQPESPDPEPPIPPTPQPPTPGPGQVVVHASDVQSGTPLAGADTWSQLAPTVKVKTDANGFALVKATSSGVCILKDGYHSPGLSTQPETCKPIGASVIELALQKIPPPAPPVEVIHADGKIFRTAANVPWRYKGVSSFKLCKRFADGEDIQPVFDAYRGFNVLRVWAYTDWAGTGWEPSSVDVTKAFFDRCAQSGFYVEFTLLTNDSQARSDWAKGFVQQLGATPHPAAVLVEGRNEPQTHSQTVSTKQLKPALDASGFVYASGNYEQSANAFGPYLVAHTQRDSEWPRRCHDLKEYFDGKGPHKPTDPAHKVPCVADEPAKTQDVAAPSSPLIKADDWRAYFGGCALLGAGATFHSESGKWGLPPTAEEATLATAALEGLNAFPADAPLGAYSRPSDKSLRTYVVGNYSVRIRPTTSTHPVSGFTRIGSSNILWKR